eukprot:COSAG06_NODE_6909_length_2721_cov_3.163997_1_plen_222_part_10
MLGTSFHAVPVTIKRGTSHFLGRTNDFLILEAWKVADVIAWLENTVKMPQYVDSFKQASVAGLSLSTVDEELLKRVGVGSLLHRLKIIACVDQLKREQQGGFDLYAQVQYQASVTLQTILRTRLVMADMQQRRRAVLHMQARSRGFLTRQDGRRQDAAVLVIQSTHRGRRDRLNIAHARRCDAAALQIQAVHRGRSERLRGAEASDAADLICARACTLGLAA